MGISISGSNSISGLGGNDTDFDKVLSQLKKIEQTQLNRLEAWKSDWNLRYEAFTQIIDQIQAASSMLSQLSDKNNFVTKIVQSSNDNVITAVANASAQDVQHTINVSQMASNAIWANTGHVFESKTDFINNTGTDQYFRYTYAGEYHEFKVPNKTTLESFVSMINNSADNPGIKVSLIQTGKGYVFQVAGKDTGVENDLIIHDSKLEGMDAVNSTSTWLANSSVNLTDELIDPNTYVIDMVLQGGTKASITVKGNTTKDGLVDAIKSQTGVKDVSIDANGNLVIDGAQSFTIRKKEDAAYVPASTTVNVEGNFNTKLNASGGIADGLADDEILTFTLTLDNGKTRTVEVKASATKKEFMVALAAATQSGSDIDIDSSKGIVLQGVANVELDSLSDKGNDVTTSALTVTKTPSKGVQNLYNQTIASATTTITFNKDKLSNRIDGLNPTDDAKDLVFTVVDKDGNAINIKGINSGMTNQQMLDAITAELDSQIPPITYTKATDAQGNTTLAIDGVKEFRLSSGSITKPAWETSLSSTLKVPGDTGLFTANADDATLEPAPDLVYTIQLNDGRKGTLTLPSGKSMYDVQAAMKFPERWTWVDADGNPAQTPSTLGAKFLDENGDEYVDADGKPLKLNDIKSQGLSVTLHLDNVQSLSGPGVSGQVATSSNWNIQKSANALFTVDNWPVEMESASNKITDAIEGVVFTIQDTGNARMTVSTDITSVEQSIQNFLDAVNSVLLTVNELMKYDENKTVTSNDPDDIGNDNYSASGLTNQKGNLLTGNYGVQLFKSRFSSTLGSTPPGFQSRTSADNILSGDILASLANLGIKTDTDSTSDTYGLLVMAPTSSIAEIQKMDKENYTDMITNHLEAVVDFFCASGIGSTSSTNFRYGSHVEGITKAGSYEVRYTVTPGGEITNVTVGGEPAKRDESQPGNYFSVGSGDPRGLSILIDDMTVGEHPPAGQEPMYVRIKQGLVQTTNQFLKDELVFNDINIPSNATPDEIADAIALKSKNGALMSLRDNYKNVMEGIDAKIEREQRRISTWEARQKAIFANLETLLNSYGEQQKQLEAQLNQLSSK